MIKKNRVRNTSLLYSMLLVISLTSCGGEGNSNNKVDNDLQSPRLATIDGIGYSKPNVTSFVNLEKNIVSQNGKAEIISITTDQLYCNSVEINKMGFFVNNQEGSLCSYLFTAKNGSLIDTGEMTILSSNSSSPILTPINKEVSVSDTLLLDLGGYITDSNQYELQDLRIQSNYTQQDQGKVEEASVGQSLVLKYTSPKFSGWERIIYTLKNKVNSSEYKIGSVYVTVSDSVNRAPEISPLQIDYPSILEPDKDQEIDLGLIQNLSIIDQEQSDLQLVHVYSSTVSVIVKQNDLLNNMSLIVNGQPGKHRISYIITDHYGGYSIGHIIINIKLPTTPPFWKHLNIGYKTFMAPPTYHQTVEGGYKATAYKDSTVNNIYVAKFDEAQATKFCSNWGQLPSLEDMKLLFTEKKPAEIKQENWPYGSNYIFRNDIGIGLFNLELGQEVSNINEQVGYVTCLVDKSSSLKFQLHNREAIADGKKIHMLTLESLFDLTQAQIDFVDKTLSSSDVTMEVKPMVTTALGFKKDIILSSLKSGNFQIKASLDGNETYSTLLFFHGDYNGAKEFQLIKSEKGNSALNKPASFTVRLVDNNDNAIPNVKTEIEDTSGKQDFVSPYPSSTKLTTYTDENGEITFSLSSKSSNDYYGYCTPSRPLSGYGVTLNTGRVSMVLDAFYTKYAIAPRPFYSTNVSTPKTMCVVPPQPYDWYTAQGITPSSGKTVTIEGKSVNIGTFVWDNYFANSSCSNIGTTGHIYAYINRPSDMTTVGWPRNNITYWVWWNTSQGQYDYSGTYPKLITSRSPAPAMCFF
ncbi:hypothetical protein [Photobacterium damselae]|uniref:hypothetical protein n=1 Tax=Photobacterium damselae TaxID=38293 RepID=UPI001F42BD7E|nr:hypothetical protein [Photobacterium damselae]UKA03995.1 hypothetical protein IHC89_15820 [Photobacterium damselae subsp. damselae]